MSYFVQKDNSSNNRRRCLGAVIIGALLLYLLLSATSIQAASDEINTFSEPIVLNNHWQSQIGDDPAWANPDFNDAGWTARDIAQIWQVANNNGFSWYRCELKLSSATQAAQQANLIALLLPPIEYGAYQIYANGQLIGSYGLMPPNADTPLPQPLVVSLPASIFQTDGRLVLAVRLWQDQNSVRRAKYYSARQDSFDNRSALGIYQMLKDQIEVARQHRRQADLIKFIMSLFFIVVGLYHLQLYYGRRQLTEYFWFALIAFGFGINIFCNSVWANGFIAQIYVDAIKVSMRQAVLWPYFQFLSLLLMHPIKRVLRIYLMLQLLFVLLIVVWPDIVLTPANGLMFLLFLPVLFVPIVMAIRELSSKNPDVWPILIGLTIVALIECLEIIRVIGLMPLPLLAHWGFFALVVSMVIILNNRFNRVYHDLDHLNQELETKVEDRTAALATANTQLAETVSQLQEAQSATEQKNRQLDQKISELREKNQELIASQKQADRIFSALAEALPGTVLDGKYRLDEKIGSGGYGAVFRATHLALNTAIAVKVFRPTSGNDSPEAIERFRQEGISACRVNHPNAVSVLDSGVSAEGIAYIVMELLVGISLKQELTHKGTLTVARCAEIITPVCLVLAEAHTAGIVHRDIKPDNIFLHQGKQGEIIKVVDFGIAKLISDQQDDDQQNLTESGNIVGTPIYMAPERLKNIAYDGRADVYSLGVTLYEMLTGARPFSISSNNIIEIIMKSLKTVPTPLKQHNPAIPSAIETVVMAALEKDPAKRPTARELAEMFAEAAADSLRI